jgi:hypothetical protein
MLRESGSCCDVAIIVEPSGFRTRETPGDAALEGPAAAAEADTAGLDTDVDADTDAAADVGAADRVSSSPEMR